ncbi:MAG: hypothetical protein GX218_08840 [Clostridiaceae bacterium]|jgi:hypothetical protein|nr:hypothetical protein [Clostridiaceae bacterium]
MAESKRGAWFRWLKWGDFVIVALVALLAVALLLAMPDRFGDSRAAAHLTCDGEILCRWTADQLWTGGETTIEAHGYHYMIIWGQGRIRFAEADCPDQVCVRTGWLKSEGNLAACVPGHLILKISGATSEPTEPDVIVR